MHAMTKNVQIILFPLLVASYVSGLKVITIDTSNRKSWFGFLYFLLLWSLYYFLLIYEVIPYIRDYSLSYFVCLGLYSISRTLTVILGVWYEKTFRNCIKQLNIVDDTLEKLGITTNYKQLRTEILLFVIGLFITLILLISVEALFLYKIDKFNIVQVICIPCVFSYNHYINVLESLRFTCMLRYIGLKFDQLNKHLKQVATANEHEISLSKEHPLLMVSRHTRFQKSCISEYTTWIVIHLYSELRKISQKMNLIFKIQITLEMGISFALTAMNLQEIFRVKFLYNYKHDDLQIYVIIIVVYAYMHFLRMFYINYECEKVVTKVTLTRQLINKLCSSRNVVIRENVLQFLLHIVQAPLKFYGCGLFEFGFKFFYRIIISIATVVIITAQVHANKMRF